MSTTRQPAMTPSNYRIAEVTVLVISVALGAALIGALRAEHVGEEWHPAAVAVLSGGLGAALMSAIMIPMLVAMTSNINRGTRLIRSEVGNLAKDQLTFVAEVARLRATLRDRDAELAELTAKLARIVSEELPRAIRRARARGYVEGVRARLAARSRGERLHLVRPD